MAKFVWSDKPAEPAYVEMRSLKKDLFTSTDSMHYE